MSQPCSSALSTKNMGLFSSIQYMFFKVKSKKVSKVVQPHQIQKRISCSNWWRCPMHIIEVLWSNVPMYVLNVLDQPLSPQWHVEVPIDIKASSGRCLPHDTNCMPAYINLGASKCIALFPCQDKYLRISYGEINNY